MSRAAWGAALLCALPSAAWAHLVSTRFGELYSGILHPLTTLQHLVPWVALGLLGGLNATPSARRALLWFPAGVLSGALIAEWVPGWSSVSWVNLSSMLLLGLLTVLGIKYSRSVFSVLAVGVGLTHGYANAAPELSGGGQALYLLGLTLAAYLCLVLTSGGASALARKLAWGRTAVRAGGSWILAIGLVFCGYTLLLAPPANAADDPDLRNSRHVFAFALLESRFDILDCTQQGFIEAGEVDEHLSFMIRPLDRDQSMAISTGEFDRASGIDDAELRTKVFSAADTDSNDLLTIREYRRFLIDIIDAADGNRDGELTRAELSAVNADTSNSPAGDDP